MTDFKRRAQKAAEAHANQKARLMIRSMWPSESQGAMKLRFAESFLAGASCGRGEGLREAAEIIDSFHLLVNDKPFSLIRLAESIRAIIDGKGK